MKLKENSVVSIELDDLPCRLNPQGLLEVLRFCHAACADGAKLSVRLPHPRHDLFYSDIGYVRPLLPAAFQRLENMRFEFEDILVELDPAWQERLERKELTLEEIEAASLQSGNVVAWVHVEMRVVKSNWVRSDPVLTPQMRMQLQEQLQMQMERGNMEAAETIRRFLASSPANAVVTVPPEILADL